MKQEEIPSAVASYIIANAIHLKSCMPNPRYFFAGNARMQAGFVYPIEIVKGTLVDVASYAMKNTCFFGREENGDFIPEKLVEINNPRNAIIRPYTEGPLNSLDPRTKTRITPQGIMLVVEEIPQDPNLDELRTQKGFLEFARRFGLKGNLEEAVSTIFS